MFSDFQLFSVILLLAAGQGLFLALLLLLTKNGNWQANRYLGIFTVVVAFTLVDFSIDGDVTQDSARHLRTLLWPRDYVYGPALYFYVREMTLPHQHPLFPKQWLHFLPAVLHAAFIWSLPFISNSLYLALLQNDSVSTSNWSAVADNIVIFETITAVVHVTLYLWLCVRCLNAHRHRIKSTFSYDEQINLKWLRYLVFGVIAVYLIWVFEELISDLIDLSDLFYTLLGASMISLIYAMSLFGLRQPLIFTGQSATPELADTPPPTSPQKYKTSSLSDELSEGLIDDLQQLMVQKKPYLDSQLSLPQLAELQGVSVNYVSQIINEQLQQNFFEFVNSYRIDEAKTLLEKDRKQNILTIALESGFNSKSSFYTAFKKHTGMTPGQFRKQL